MHFGKTCIAIIILIALLLEITNAATQKPKPKRKKPKTTKRNPNKPKPVPKSNKDPVPRRIIPKKVKGKGKGAKKPNNIRLKAVPYGLLPLNINITDSAPAPGIDVRVAPSDDYNSPFPDYKTGMGNIPENPDFSKGPNFVGAKKQVKTKKGIYRSRSRYSDYDSFEEEYEYVRTKEE